MTAFAIPTGRIAGDEVVTLDFLKNEMGMGQAALREARRKGLKIRYVGKRGFCIGSDLIDFIRSEGKTEK